MSTAADVALDVLCKPFPIEPPLYQGCGSLGAKVAAKWGIVRFVEDIWVE